MKSFVPLVLVIILGCVHKDSDRSLTIKTLDEGVYLHTSYKMIEGFGWVDSNGLVVVKDKQAIIIDTPWSEQETVELMSWIRAQGFQIKASVSTHFHADRTAGIAVLNALSIPTYTSNMTHEILMQKGLPTASHVFADDSLMMLNDSIKVFYPGEGHTRDNLVVWLPEHKLLFGGCLVRPESWKTLGFTGDASIDKWADSVRTVQKKFPSIERIVPGHGSVGDKSILDHTIEVVEKTIQSQPK